MSGRKPTIGGNWKMNLHGREARALAGQLAQGVRDDAVDVTVFPAFPYLAQVSAALADTPIKVGAQDVCMHANGAFTGEVSLSMLQDVGVSSVLVGHSERRHVMGESDLQVNAKLLAALGAGFEVVLAIGERLEQREAGQSDAINAAQLAYALAGVEAARLAAVSIAYEPVWAIGTGRTAAPEDAQSAHAAIRKCIGFLYNDAAAQAVRIQYGGSMKPDNAADLLAQPDIDGGLIGGASLKAQDFLAIIDAAR